VSEHAPFVIVIADPSRPAYERAAREVLAEPGWEVRMASGFDDAELVAWAADADVLITRRRAIPAAFLARAERLRSVQHIGGVPRPEVVAWAHERGVALDVTPSLGNLAVAEQALALLLAVSRQVVKGHAATVDGVYRQLGRSPSRTSEVEHGFQWAALPGLRTLYGATVGVIGLGDIGRAFAARVRAFGTTVLYHQRHRLDATTEAELSVAYRPLDELIGEVDVLSLHLPHTPETESLLDERRLRSMKPGAVLINVSRGGLVDEDALVAALRDGHLGGAGLDVFAFEPVPVDHPLLALENVVVSPHVGAAPARGLGESLEAVKPHLLRVARAMKESYA
jgi:phosphoglycerate dehydrogenase-like enzyme